MNGSAVNVFAVADSHDKHRDDAIMNLVDDSVIPNPDTVRPLSPQFETAVRAGGVGESAHGGKNPILNR